MKKSHYSFARRIGILKKVLTPPHPKKVKEKKNVPRGYRARKAGASLFWLLFGCMFLAAAANLFSGSNEANPTKATAVQKKDNPALKPEAIQFAESFTAHYFTWGASEEMKKRRAEKLQPFLAKGLDPQAGLAVQETTWNAAFKGATLKQTKDLGSSKALITFYVTADLSRESEEGEKSDTKQLSKYFVVPVTFNGESYGIYELPKFTYVKSGTTVEADAKDAFAKSADSAETRDVTKFLNTFFKSYTEDSADKLAYITEEGSDITGLQQSMTFVEVKEAAVYRGRRANEYFVKSKVKLKDPATNMQFLTDYDLTVIKDGERFVATALHEREEAAK